MFVRFYNIEWDTDGEKVDLPSEITFEVDDDFDVENKGADLLSDNLGWCIRTFNFEKDIDRYPPDKDPLDDLDIDQNNPVDMSADDWLEFYATHPDYDIDHDHSMDY